MGAESKDTQDLIDDPVASLFRQFRKKEIELPFPKEAEFKVFVGNLGDPLEREEYEKLLTKSYRCQSYLEKAGDLVITSIDGTFDKAGDYHVVARYVIMPEKTNE